MYVHLGDTVVVRDSDIIGIFDLDSTTSEDTAQFLRFGEEQSEITAISPQLLPKSFIVTLENGSHRIYTSPIGTRVLKSRKAMSLERIQKTWL